MRIEKLHGSPFGAVVHDAPVGPEISDGAVEQIRRAVDEHIVLVFRGHQYPSDEDLIAFGRRFGYIPRTGLNAGKGAAEMYNEMLLISNIIDDNGAKIGVGDANFMDWHTDYSFRPKVSQFGFLSAVELPRKGGETAFTNMYAAYESMTPELRGRLANLSVRHSLRGGYEDHIEDVLQGEVLNGDPARSNPADGTSTVHPLLARNPRTGRSAIYVNPLNSKKIIEYENEESTLLLKEMFKLPGREDISYTHHWQEGDIVLWDQLGTVHARLPFDNTERRKLRKVVTIFDDAQAPWKHAHA